VRRFVPVLLIPVVFSCSSLERAKECRAIADTVNPNLEAMDGALNHSPLDLSALERESRQAVDRLRDVPVRDATLKRIVDELSENLKRVSLAASEEARRKARGEDRGDDTKLLWTTVTTKHTQQVRAIQNHCRR
jgi:acyl-CoA reductase-like NAD-dependent aldehyde dehydrogenase